MLGRRAESVEAASEVQNVKADPVEAAEPARRLRPAGAPLSELVVTDTTAKSQWPASL
jgi:hypothetical protein